MFSKLEDIIIEIISVLYFYLLQGLILLFLKLLLIPCMFNKKLRKLINNKCNSVIDYFRI